VLPIELRTDDNTMKDTYYIGLDVHAKTVAIAWAGPGNALEYYGTCASSNRSVDSTLRKIAGKLGTEFKDLRVCYEAGPTGFVLARHLIKLGLDVTVVAPSLIPQRAGERIKTDTRDALKLARLHRAGELKPIHIPDANDEAIRDVCRARTDASDDLRRAKQRLGAFLLRNGHTYTGKCKWTPGHFRYLRELALPCPVQKIVLEEYLQAVDLAEDRIARLEKHMEEQLQTWQRRAEVAATMAMKGFKMVGGMIIASELGDLRRFEHPRQLMGYLGLVPGEHSSGGTRRQGAITKCGNAHVRWMLIESAKAYTKPAKVGLDLTRRQEGIPRAIKELSWRAQNRLGMKYRKLAARGVHVNKAITAIARELCAFLWELHVKVLPAHPIAR
jgi:transposase